MPALPPLPPPLLLAPLPLAPLLVAPELLTLAPLELPLDAPLLLVPVAAASVPVCGLSPFEPHAIPQTATKTQAPRTAAETGIGATTRFSIDLSADSWPSP